MYKDVGLMQFSETKKKAPELEIAVMKNPGKGTCRVGVRFGGGLLELGGVTGRSTKVIVCEEWDVPEVKKLLLGCFEEGWLDDAIKLQEIHRDNMKRELVMKGLLITDFLERQARRATGRE